jgi:hypothetical protein
MPTKTTGTRDQLLAIAVALATLPATAGATPAEDGKALAAEQTRLPIATTPPAGAKAPLSRKAIASAIAAAQRDIPAAPTPAPLAAEADGGRVGALAAGKTAARVDAAARARAEAIARAHRGAKLPPEIDHGVAVDYAGRPLRSRRAIFVRTTTVGEGDLLREVAYRYSTSPRSVAELNNIRWESEGTELVAGETLQVPVRYRSASGFAEAKRLETGPGVRMDRPHSAWGRPYVVDLLRNAFRATASRWPGRHPFIVHDISRFGGGRLGGHKSHRAGRDIDIGYPTRQAEREGWGVPALASIDYERLWFFIDRLERSGYTAAIYMAPAIQRRLHAHAQSLSVPEWRLKVLFQYPAAHGQKTTLIRHAKGHRDHFHVRFSSPEDLEELSS